MHNEYVERSYLPTSAVITKPGAGGRGELDIWKNWQRAANETDEAEQCAVICQCLKKTLYILHHPYIDNTTVLSMFYSAILSQGFGQP